MPTALDIYGPVPAPAWCDLGCRVCWEIITPGTLCGAIDSEQVHWACWEDHLAGHATQAQRLCHFCRHPRP
jgi:hypothetical protein